MVQSWSSTPARRSRIAGALWGWRALSFGRWPRQAAGRWCGWSTLALVPTRTPPTRGRPTAGRSSSATWSELLPGCNRAGVRKGGWTMRVNFSSRVILRWIHIIVAIPIYGYIYSPFDKLPQYAPPTRFVFFPLMVLTGLLMWKGHVVRRLIGWRNQGAERI